MWNPSASKQTYLQSELLVPSSEVTAVVVVLAAATVAAATVAGSTDAAGSVVSDSLPPFK